MNSPEIMPRLLLTELHHLGDAVLAFPFIRSASRQYEVHCCCRPAVRDVFRLVLPDDRIISWQPPWHEDTPDQGRLAKIRDLRRQALAWQKQKFSVAVGVWADPRVQNLWAAAGIPVRAGFSPNVLNHYGSHLPERAARLRINRLFSPLLRMLHGGRPPLTHSLARNPQNPHQLEAWGQLCDVLHLPREANTPWLEYSAPVIPVFDEARREGKKILLVHTGGRRPTKLWPAGHWQSLLLSCRNTFPEYAVFSMAGPGDPPAPEVPGVSVLSSPGAVSGLADILSGADFLLAHDSFPAHLAFALGKDVLAIFGSGDPAWFSPGGDPLHAVAADNCPWRPCLDRCRMASRICLEGLSPATVLEKLHVRLRPGRE